MSNGSPSRPDDVEFNVDVKSVPLAPIFMKINKPLDVIHVLHAYAFKLKVGLIILSAFGSVRNVVLPMTSKKTYDDGIYQMLSLSGRIVPPKRGGIAGNLNLIMSDFHGATIGGLVQSLVAETTVEVTVSPFYYDRSVSQPFHFDPPMLFGNPFLPSSSDSNPDDPSSSDPCS